MTRSFVAPVNVSRRLYLTLCKFGTENSIAGLQSPTKPGSATAILQSLGFDKFCPVQRYDSQVSWFL